MTPYLYRCPTCGVREVRKPMAEAARPESCPDCGQVLVRIYTVPMDVPSFGRNSFVTRTPTHRRRVTSERQERRRWEASRAAGITSFGYQPQGGGH